jgi:hypothetical protein
VFLDLGMVEGVAREMLGVLVDVTEEDGLGVVWTDVFSAAGITVATGADFVEEGTVDFVLLRSAG